MPLAYVIPRVQTHKLVLTAARSRFASGVGPIDVTIVSNTLVLTASLFLEELFALHGVRFLKYGVGTCRPTEGGRFQ